MAEPLTEMKDQPSETAEQLSEIRVGVFVCDCGREIAGALDTEALCQRARELPDVAYVTHENYPCSQDGRARMLQAIREQGLGRVLVAGCSPRLMRSMFRDLGQTVGLARSFVNMANLREQCVYSHADHPKATFEKALGLVDMGVARLMTTTAETPRSGRVVKSALLIGSDLPALTLATNLADQGFQVTVVEHGSGFGETLPDDLLTRTRQQLFVKGQQVVENPLVDVLFNAHVTEVTGHPGDYTVRIQQGNLTLGGSSETLTRGVGAIIVANAARPKTLGDDQWFDRARVKTQAEFESELDQATEPGNWLTLENIVMVFCAEKSQLERCSRVCCNIGIRQAMRAKQLNPKANVTVLFRELYLGGAAQAAEAELAQAREMGLTLFRYRRDCPPVITDQTVNISNPLIGETIRIPYDRVVLTMPLVPQDHTRSLAAILGLPLDEDGFLAEPRLRLRPGRYTEPGMYALGSAQQPADTDEALFQAYLTSSRVARFLSQDSIKVETPAAKIDPALCTGCGNCPQVCPMAAIRLEKRDGILSLSEVDELRCFGCGNCVVVCPTKAIALPGWDDAVIPAQISAALRSPTFQDGAPKIIALTCEWSAYAAADVAGARGLIYPPNVRIIRTNCSARFDPYHILWAFLNGADGVFLGACPPGECHYGSGNLYAKERTENLKTELAAHGIDPRRLRLEYLTVEDGRKFANAITEFMHELSYLPNKDCLLPKEEL